MKPSTNRSYHEGLRAPGSGPDDQGPETRKSLPLWDRVKFLLLLGVAFLVLTWKTMADFEGIISFPEAMRSIAGAYQWIFWLIGLELVRQVHFLISEHWAGYHRFWSKGVFGGFDRWTHRRFSDWTRFRISRVLKIAFFVALLAMVLGAVLDTSPFVALFQAPALLFMALPFVAQLAFAFFFIVFQFIGLFWFLSRGGVETYFPDDIKTRFKDVWGQDHVVERVRENIVFLERPEEIEEKGGYVPGGLLLWGPPGTGKTLMAEAVAGETGKPYVFVDPGAFINMFMGIGILKVKSLFRKLRKLALRYGGVIVFFDEADSLGRRGRLAGQPQPGQGFSGCHGMNYLSEETRATLAFRARRPVEDEQPRNRFFMGGNMGGMGDMGTLQALLTELSGLKKPRGFFNRLVRRALGMRPKPPPKYRILVMMATNMPDALDEALLRPGRIDRIYKVGYPSKAGRVRTYQGYFGKVAHELTDEQIDKLATITPYATGATIKDLVNEALITAIRDGRDVITWSDVLKAKRLKQLGPPEDVEYIERERHAVAVHEACHAVIAYRTRYHLEIDIATIEKGADYLGMVASIKPEDQFTRWKSEYEADIMVSLASLAGERMFFGDDNSSGVSGDLHSATFLTALMESHWGMGTGVASLPALQQLEIMGGKAMPRQRPTGGPISITDRDPKRRSPDYAPDMLGERIEFNLVRLMEKTEELLRRHRRDVLAVAHALEVHKTLNGEDVVAVIEQRRGPLVDGGIYASDEFYQEIEEYHEEAARAHREHSRVMRELPGVEPELREPEQAALVPAERPIAGEVIDTLPAGTAPHATATRTAAPPNGLPATAAARNALPEVEAGPPEFVPWTPPEPSEAAPDPREAAPARGGGRGVWVVVGSLLALVALALAGALVATGALSPPAAQAQAPGIASPGLLILLFVIVVAIIVGVGVAAVAIRGMRAAQARAENDRDRANARAQLLAAAMDPETAMRLLGYDGPRDR
ncbi:AAA family ATPase [Thermoactinospora rubra]|uniref:AAA family ATPase n=1 Tax=Thermoactinospora rubra TaxID=1088767 RepID=UPI000A11BC1E|nr:AAA family ATPase [Thermoactinospora rubra]